MNADMKWLDNPEVFRVNQLEAHSDHTYYESYEALEKKENALIQSLNGQWEFAFSKNVKSRPENFYEEDFDAKNFDKIMVPGHIELAGYDKIRYIMNEMKSDIECILRNNINAVRTCHYPDQIPWYYMCDAAGIYMMAENNLESHGTFQKLGAIEPSCNVPGSIPQWKEAVVDRARTNFETFKNHTAILFWSLGNESYAGDDIEAMNTYYKEKQDGRLIHYESSFYNRAYEDTISDVESRMYAKPYEIKEYLDNDPKKPYLLCEFMHDMGNSMGGLGTYMHLIDKYDMYHGGFIWDFIDQALYVKDEVTGKEVLRYGGDFDDRPSDYEFSGDGIVFANRVEKPAMQEVRYYYGLYR